MSEPIAIHNRPSYRMYHDAPQIIKDAWDQYAQSEADMFNANHNPMDKSTSTLHKWTPPLSFREFCDKHSPHTPKLPLEENFMSDKFHLTREQVLLSLIDGDTLEDSDGNTLRLPDLMYAVAVYKVDTYLTQLQLLHQLYNGVWYKSKVDGMYEVQMHKASRETTYLSLIKGVWYDCRYINKPVTVEEPYAIICHLERKKV